MSSNKNQKLNSSKVVTPEVDENTNQPVIESAPQESDLNPLTAKIAGLPQEQAAMIASFQGIKSMFVSDKVSNDAFKLFMQNSGLYETSNNAAEAAKLQGEIDKVKSALKVAGFAEDNPIVVSAVKGLTAELTKAEKEVKDNLPELATYFGVKLAKVQGNRTYAVTGQLKGHKATLEELKTTDYLFDQQDKKVVIVHSQSISESALTTLKIKADSQKWIGFEYNGELQHTRLNDHVEGDSRMLGDITYMPENWLKVHELVSTTGTLSNLLGVVAATVGLQYNGNGWQSNTQLNKKFDKITRVVKA